MPADSSPDRWYISLFDRILRKAGAGEMGQRLASSSIGIFALKLFSIGAAFVTTLILTNTIGAEGYGAYAYAIGWIWLLMVPAVFGLDRLLVREIPVLVQRENWSLLRGLLVRSHQLVLSLGILLAIVLGVVFLFAGPSFTTISEPMRWSIIAALPLLPALALLRLRQTILMGLNKVVQGQIGELLIYPLLTFTGIGILALFTPEALSPVTALLIALVSAVIAVIYLVVRTRSVSPVQIRTTAATFAQRQWLVAAAPMVFIAGMAVVNQRVDIIMVGSMMGAETVGVYAVANRLALLVLLVYHVISLSLAPVISSLYEQGNQVRMQNLITRSTRMMMIFGIPAALMMILLGRWFLSFFGAGFTLGYEPLVVISIAQVAAMFFGSVSTVLVMTGLERQAAIGVGISATLNIVLNLLLIPHYGMLGAAWALAVGQVMAVALMSLMVYRHLGYNSTPFGRTM